MLRLVQAEIFDTFDTPLILEEFIAVVDHASAVSEDSPEASHVATITEHIQLIGIRIHVQDGVEPVHNGLLGAGSEIILEKLIASAAVFDIREGGGSQGLSFRDAVSDDGPSAFISALGLWASLLEFELALGGVVGDGDGDGMSIGDDYGGGTRRGINRVVEPDHLEPRHRLERESS